MKITIDLVYPDKDTNPILVEMFNIIAFRKQNKLTFIPKRHAHRYPNYIECKKHHIIPRCYYKFFKQKVDNSEDNLICLTHEEHIRVHELLDKYYSTQNTHLSHYLHSCHKKAHTIMNSDNKTYKLSSTNKEIWNNYSDEQKQQRCDNISTGTKIAMANLDTNIWKKSKLKAAKTLSENCKKRTPKRKAELHVSYGKYHIGSKAMSNNITHHWRYVSIEEQETYLKNGYEFGNNSKMWIEHGYVKVDKGRYALP